MKVLLINGSPHQKGCTYTALREVEKTLNEEGIETELIQIGSRIIRGCVACNACDKLDRCVFNDDPVNEIGDKLRASDGIVVGSPVYYAGPNGTLVNLLTRIFYSNGEDLSMKVGAAVVSCRRSGATATFEQLNKFFTISGMPVASSQYWNNVHGFTAKDVEKDLEGLQTMRTLAHNMAFLMRGISAAKESEGLPEKETRVSTSFPDGL